MKAKTNSRKVQDIWEVLLSPQLMDLLRQTAQKRQTTMSWVARYCLFKLVNKKHLHLDHLQNLKMDIKANQPPVALTKRFFLCLYGEDILLIKMRAAALNLTVSMLLRIALQRYLRVLYEGRVSDWRLFWYGLKLKKRVLIHRWRKHYVHAKEFLNTQPFLLEDYWKLPPGPLPTFLYP